MNTAEKLPACFALGRDQINEYWCDVSNFLVKVENADWDLNDVRVDLLQSKAQLWGYMVDGWIKGVWITKIIDKTVGLIWIAAGEGIENGYGLFVEHTEPWFRQKGCKVLRIVGREGWQRVLPEFERVAVVLEKRL